jgi:hypothetical protein
MNPADQYIEETDFRTLLDYLKLYEVLTQNRTDLLAKQYKEGVTEVRLNVDLFIQDLQHMANQLADRGVDHRVFLHQQEIDEHLQLQSLQDPSRTALTTDDRGRADGARSRKVVGPFIEPDYVARTEWNTCLTPG